MKSPPPPPAAPSVPASIQIAIGAQYIKDFSFESPSAPQIFASLHMQPQLSIDVNVLSRGLGDSNYEAVLMLKLESKIDGKTAFIAELSYAGLFGLPEVPDEQAKLFLMVEAPRLLFPFARAIIANAVREGGYPNIIIQPIDFMSLYASRLGSIGTMTTAGAA
jgi:preprotein translocase subunit SecB